MADQTPRRTSRWLSELAERALGRRVAHLSLPGGAGRQSLRVHFEDGGTVIATLRQNAARGALEADFLAALCQHTHAVPAVLARREGVLFQQDAGRQRLSHALMQAPDRAARLALARAALDSLAQIRAAVTSQPDLCAKLPALAESPAWRARFLDAPTALSARLALAAPQVDRAALLARLSRGGRHFARWDARAGNAAVQPDGRVVWFDWEAFGRGAGVEDVAWLVVDDFWTLSPEETRAVLAEVDGGKERPGLDTEPDPEARQARALFAVLIAANRLGRVADSLERTGWTPVATALRHDRVAAAPEIIARVAAHGGAWAAQDPALAGYVAWFEAVREALCGR